MMIRNMFAEDINRQINGVIKVDQDTTDVIEQEVREYVITKELKKHFITFFNNYVESFHAGELVHPVGRYLGYNKAVCSGFCLLQTPAHQGNFQTPENSR